MNGNETNRLALLNEPIKSAIGGGLESFLSERYWAPPLEPSVGGADQAKRRSSMSPSSPILLFSPYRHPPSTIQNPNSNHITMVSSESHLNIWIIPGVF
ncbi:unnamed protein product [Anisakis simplex]|uniref:Uncharacterized protein n=1 Tax=Anisakis simplex TaxID=6269 RepID=A0A0M3K2T8_ANISI|nr:unnamed protein product [Anisakis simplex]